MNNKAGPLLDEWNDDTKGVILRELITYRFVDDILYKEVVTRRFRNSNDYHDVKQTTPLK